jgi:hypothetical protein
MNSVAITLAPGVAQLLVPASVERAYLCLEMTGVNPATFKFGSAPANATDGTSLDPASNAGGQGGSLCFQDRVPINAVYAISASGTTVAVTDGSDAGY